MAFMGVGSVPYRAAPPAVAVVAAKVSTFYERTSLLSRTQTLAERIVYQKTA
jgi:hypothetical protein